MIHRTPSTEMGRGTLAPSCLPGGRCSPANNSRYCLLRDLGPKMPTFKDSSAGHQTGVRQLSELKGTQPWSDPLITSQRGTEAWVREWLWMTQFRGKPETRTQAPGLYACALVKYTTHIRMHSPLYFFGNAPRGAFSPKLKFTHIRHPQKWSGITQPAGNEYIQPQDGGACPKPFKQVCRNLQIPSRVVPSTCASNSVLAPEGSSLIHSSGRNRGLSSEFQTQHSLGDALGRWPNLVLTSVILNSHT